MTTWTKITGAAKTLHANLIVKLDVPKGDLTGQTIIVSGSNQGLGFEASRHLLQLGVSKLIMAVRREDKGKTAREELLKSTGRPESTIEVWKLDMDEYASVKEFATRAKQLPRLDAVLANAGMRATKFERSEGMERSITVNVVNTFLLITLLIPKLRASAQEFGITPRVTIPNSALHYMAPLKELDVGTNEIFNSLNNEKTTNMEDRYPLTKLLVLFSVRALADRLEQKEGPLIVINTPNPSFCQSELMREMNTPAFRRQEKYLARTTEEGSRTLVNGILAGEESNGKYLNNCHVESPACTVTDEKGVRIQKAFFEALVAKLEEIAPGVTSGF